MRIAKLAIVAMLALASACSGTSSVKEARAKVDAFHHDIDTGNIDAVWNDSSEDVTKTSSKETLGGLLNGIHQRFGNVKETTQSGWKVNYNNGVSTTELTMETTFDNGKLEEHFLFRGGDGGLKLAGYQFNQK